MAIGGESAESSSLVSPAKNRGDLLHPDHQNRQERSSAKCASAGEVALQVQSANREDRDLGEERGPDFEASGPDQDLGTPVGSRSDDMAANHSYKVGAKSLPRCGSAQHCPSALWDEWHTAPHLGSPNRTEATNLNQTMTLYALSYDYTPAGVMRQNQRFCHQHEDREQAAKGEFPHTPQGNLGYQVLKEILQTGSHNEVRAKKLHEDDGHQQRASHASPPL
ncbi:hypothetical protein Efla_001502 [Eimeria flavescens]